MKIDFNGLRYIKDSFVLQKVKFDKYGNITQIISEKNIGNEVQFSENGTKFRFIT